MKILILGGTNFIGPYVIRHLHAMGYHDITLFHRRGQSEIDLPATVKHIYGDKMNLEQHRTAFQSLSPEVVVDMIAYTEKDTELVLHTFRGITNRLVMISSQDVYRAYGVVRQADKGPLEQLPITEASTLRNNRYPYQDPAKDPDDWCNRYDKIPLEEMVMNDPYIRATIVRLPAVYGPNDPQHRLFHYFKLKPLRDSKPVILLDEGYANWLWTHGYVEDVAYGIALAITNEHATGRLYNITEAQTRTMLDFIHAIGEQLDWKGKIIQIPSGHLPDELGIPLRTEQNIIVESNRIREELGYREAFSFKEGLKKTIAWELAHLPAEIDHDYDKEDAMLKELREAGVI
ncbi:dTDP-glucose 4,6-dehydratase [Paenibacillus chitinolyticus]|uniref:NAD-dependent epimerase/dehydratase family protein n=2 Tax=Paenibacillus chitinolyticus TaxID=79263 RepID=UPI0026E4C9F6|nr:NAD-dependent epimerase/dehydratase family protein [Paenibacillus chitinolyticus]GKS12424.1 dTDP-glucose 4,6-dehydratase [Paenibacillus chitinolyticus]